MKKSGIIAVIIASAVVLSSSLAFADETDHDSDVPRSESAIDIDNTPIASLVSDSGTLLLLTSTDHTVNLGVQPDIRDRGATFSFEVKF